MRRHAAARVKILFVVLAALLAAACEQPNPHDLVNERLRIVSRSGQSDVWLDALGTIYRVLPDDNKGARHQRIIVEIDPGFTVLVVHNIDLAPRIKDPVVGERLQIRGEYVWNDQGGLIHWTHHDPRGQHDGGQLVYQGQVYR